MIIINASRQKNAKKLFKHKKKKSQKKNNMVSTTQAKTEAKMWIIKQAIN